MARAVKSYTMEFPTAEWAPLEAYAKSEKSAVARIVRLACEAYLRDKVIPAPIKPESRVPAKLSVKIPKAAE